MYILIEFSVKKSKIKIVNDRYLEMKTLEK